MLATYCYAVIKMLKIFFLFLSFFIASCNANEPLINPLKPELESMSFDVVQKKLVIEKEIPNQVQSLLSQWFNQKVKIDGFEGDLIFIVSDFTQVISSIADGKKVDITMSFEVIINKPSLSQKKLIDGNISSYGTLTGNFTLNEFDTVIYNTQSDLILRLTKDLKSKI